MPDKVFSGDGFPGGVQRGGPHHGFSLIEVTTVLTVVSLMIAMLVPAIGDHVDVERETRAAREVRTLGTALVRMTADLPFARQGQTARGWAEYDLLVSSGAIPEPSDMTTDEWVSPLDQPEVGFLDHHLVSNKPGYSVSSGSGIFGWRGPYVHSPIGADPWGRRYALNVAALLSSRANAVVLSAGPDGIIDTPFGIMGPWRRGDDVTVLLAPGSAARTRNAR